jgi:septum site-determining protein MinD
MSDAFYNRGNQRQRLIINKVTKNAMGYSLVRDLDEIIDTIGVQLIGVIPEDYQVVASTGTGQPIPSGSPSLNALGAIAKRVQGEEVPLTIKIG